MATKILEYIGAMLQPHPAPLPFKERAPFGVETWSKIGSMEGSPVAPESLLRHLNAPCPFWPDKRVKDTHVLLLVPGMVNGKPMTLSSLKEAVEKALHISGQQDSYFFGGQHDAQPIGDSYWILVTVQPIPHSSLKTLEEQKNMLSAHQYRLPKLAEMVAFYAGARFNEEWDLIDGTYTRCQEESAPLCTIAIKSPKSQSDFLDIEYYDRDSGVFAVRSAEC